MNTFKLYPKQDFSTSFVKLFRNLVRNCQGSKIGKKGNSNSVRQLVKGPNMSDLEVSVTNDD